MLVLERRVGERVVVPGARLEIEVVSITPSGVRLGFRAPDRVDIFRAEIWSRMAFDSWNEGEWQPEKEDVK